MLRWLSIGLVALLVSNGCSVAQFEVHSNDTDFEIPPAAELIQFVEENTSYKYNLSYIPKIFIDDRAVFDHLRRTDVVGTVLWDPVSQEFGIFLTHDAPSSTIVHEFIHVVQAANGVTRKTTCLGLIEAEAYRLENIWIDRTGSSDQKTSPLYIIGLESRCALE